MRIEHHFQLIDVITGYQAAAAVGAAQRLGVFATLGSPPQQARELAIRLGADERGLRALLDSLVALGLLERLEGGYAATPFGLAELGPGGELALVIEKENHSIRWIDQYLLVRLWTWRLPCGLSTSPEQDRQHDQGYNQRNGRPMLGEAFHVCLPFI